MSNSIDNRIVKMEFDNAQFESGIAQSLKTLTNLDEALNNLDKVGGAEGFSKALGGIQDAMDEAFSGGGIAKAVAWGNTISNVVQKAFNVVSQTLNKFKDNYTGGIDFLGQIVSGGKNRASNIENAKFTLDGLGVQWSQISKDINYSVDQTAFGLDAAAKAASQLVASGVRFGESFGDTGNSPMAKALRGISGVAAMTNSEFDDIANLFTAIAGKGKVQAMELNRFAYRGLNMAATLAKEFNYVLDGDEEHLKKFSADTIQQIKKLKNSGKITEADIREFASKGKINFAMFSEAANDAFGEHAAKANETYAGSLSNVRAALSRLGAKYFTPHMESMTKMFNGLRLAINGVSAGIEPLINMLNTVEAEWLGGLGKVLSSGDIGTVFAAIGRMGYQALYPIGVAFKEVFSDWGPEAIGNSIHALAEFLKNLNLTWEFTTKLRWAAQAIFEVFKIAIDVIKTVGYVLSPLLEPLGMIVSLILEIIADIGHGLATLDEAAQKSEKLAGAIEFFRNVAVGLAAALELIIAGIGLFADYVVENFDAIIAGAGGVIGVLGTLLAMVGGGVLMGLLGVGAAVARVVGRVLDLVNLFKSAKEGTRAFGGELGLIEGAVFRAGQAFYDLKDRFSKFVESLKSSLPDVSKEVGKIFKIFTGDSITDLNSFDYLKGKFEEVKKAAKEFSVGLNNAFEKGGIDSAVDYISEKVGEWGENLSKNLEKAGPSIDSIKQKFEKFSEEGLQNLRESFSGTFVGDIIESLIAGYEKLQEFFDKLTKGTGGIKEAFQELTLFGKPLKEFANPIDLITTAIQKACEQVKKLHAFFDELKTAFQTGGLTGALDLLKQKFDSAFTSIKEKYEALKPTLENIGKTLKDNLTTVFSNLGDMLSQTSIGKGFIKLKDNVKAFGDTIKSSFDGLKNTTLISSVKDAFDSLFDSIGKSLSAGKMSSTFDTITDAFKRFKDSVAGAFTLDNIINVVKELVKWIQSLGDTFKTAISSMADGPVKSALDWLVEKFEAIKKAVKDFFDTIVQNNPTSILGRIGTALGGLFGESDKATKGVTKGMPGLVKDTEEATSAFDGIKSGFSGFFAVVESVYNSIKSFASSSALNNLITLAAGGALIAFLTFTLPKFVSQLTLGIGKAEQAVQDVKDEYKEAKKKIGDIVKDIGDTVNGTIDKVFGLANNIVSTVKGALTMNNVAKVIKAVGLAVLEIAAALWLIGQLDTDQLKQSGIALGIIAGVLVLVTAFLVHLDKSYTKMGVAAQGLIKTGGGAKSALIGAAVLIASIAASMFVMAKVLDTLMTIKMPNLMQSIGIFTGFAVLLGLFAAAVILISKYAPKLSTGGIMMLALALSVSKLIDSFLKIVDEIQNATKDAKSLVSWNNAFFKALGVVALMLAGIAAIAAFGSKFKLSSGLGLLSIVATILLFEQVFKSLVRMFDMVAQGTEEDKFAGLRQFGKALAALAVVVGLIAGLMALTKLAGKHAASGGVAVLLITTSMMLMSPLLKTVANLSKETEGINVGNVISILFTLFTGMALLMASTHFASAKSIVAGAAISGMVLVVTACIGILTLIAGIAPEKIKIATDVMLKMGLMLTALMLVSSMTKNAKPTALLGIMAVLGSVVMGLAVLSLLPDSNKLISASSALFWVISGIALAMAASEKASKSKGAIFLFNSMLFELVVGLGVLASGLVDIKQLLAASAGLTAVLLALSICMSTVGKKSKDIKAGAILGLIAIVGVVATSLYFLSGRDWGSMLASAVAMVAVLTAVFKGMEKLSKLKLNWKNIAQFATMAAILGVIAVELYEVAKQPWDSLLASGISMTITLIALAEAMQIISDVDADWKTIGQFAVIAVSLVAVGYALSELAVFPWDSILASTIAINATMYSLIGVLALLSHVSVEWETVGGFAVMVVSLVAVGYALSEMALFPWESITAAALAMNATMYSLVGVLALLKNVEVNLEGILGFAAMVVALIAVGYAMSEIAGFDWQSILAAAGALAGVMVILALISSLASGDLMAGATIFVLAAAVVVLAVAFNMLAQIPMDAILSGLVGIAGGLLVFVVAAAALAFIAEIFSAGMATIAIVFIAFAAAVWIFSEGVVNFSIAAQNFADAMATLDELGDADEIHDLAEALSSGLIDGVVDGLENLATDVFEAIKEQISSIDVGEMAADAWAGVKGIGGSIVDSIFDGIKEAWDNRPIKIGQFIGDLITGDAGDGGITQAMEPVKEDVKEAAHDIPESVAEGINDSVSHGYIYDGLTTFGGWLYDGFCDITGFHCDVPEYVEAGHDIPESVATGMTDATAAGYIAEGANGLAESAINTLASAFEEGFAWLSQQIAAAASSLGSAFEGFSFDFNFGDFNFGTFTSSATAAVKSIGSVSNAVDGIKKKGFDKYLQEDVATAFKDVEIAGINLGEAAEKTGKKISSVKKNVEEHGVFGAILDEFPGAKEALEQIKSAFEDAGKGAEDLGNGAGKAGNAAGKSAEDLEKAAEAARRHAKAMKLTSEVVNEFAETYGIAYEQVEDVSVFDIAKDAIAELAITFGDTAEDIGKDGKTIEDVFYDLYESTVDAISGSIDLFSEFKTEASGSAKDLVKNIQTNLKAMDEWAQKLEWLAARGFSAQFINELREQGLKSLPLVNQALKASFQEMVQINDSYSQKLIKSAEAAKKALEAQAYAMKTADAVAAMASEDNKDAMVAIQKTILETAGNIQGLAATYTEMRDTLKETINNQIKYFEKFDRTCNTSASEMLAGLNDQIAGLTEWAAMFDKLGGKASSDLLGYLASLGPEGYEKIAALSRATDEEIAAIDQSFQTLRTLGDTLSVQMSTNLYNGAVNAAKQTGVGLLEGWTQSDDAVIAQAAQTGIDMINKLEIGLGVASPSWKARDAAMYVGQGFNNGWIQSSATILTGMQTTGTDAIETLKTTLVEGLLGSTDEVLENVTLFSTTASETFDNGIITGIENTKESVVSTVQNLNDEINSTTEEGLSEENGSTYGTNFSTGIQTAIEEGTGPNVAATDSLGAQVRSTAEGGLSFDVGHGFGSNIASGIAQGIRDGIADAVAAMREMSEAVQNAEMSDNEMHSPSKVFARFGRYLVEGLANGIRDNAYRPEQEIDNVSHVMQGAAQSLYDLGSEMQDYKPVITPVLDLSEVEAKSKLLNEMFNGGQHSIGFNNIKPVGQQIASMGRSSTTNTTTYGSININVYAQPDMDANQIADLTLKKLNNQMARRKAVYA